MAAESAAEQSQGPSRLLGSWEQELPVCDGTLHEPRNMTGGHKPIKLRLSSKEIKRIGK